MYGLHFYGRSCDGRKKPLLEKRTHAFPNRCTREQKVCMGDGKRHARLWQQQRRRCRGMGAIVPQAEWVPGETRLWEPGQRAAMGRGRARLS